MTNPYVSVDDVETVLNRDLTDSEAFRVDVHLDAIVVTLEGWLNRYIYPRQIENEKHTFYFDSEHLQPFYGPVDEDSVVIKTRTGDNEYRTFTVNQDWRTLLFPMGTVLYIDYTAGDPVDGPNAALYRGVILDTITASVLSGVAIDTGALTSYSVEGTSISFRDRASGGSVGKVDVPALLSMTPLRRPTVR